MENANCPQKARFPKLRYVYGLILAGAVLAGVYSVLREFDYLFATSELHDAISAYRNEGLPWQPTDLGLQSIPDNQNAASGIKSALSHVPTAIYKESTDRYDGTSPKGNSSFNARRALKQLGLHSIAFAQMMEASKKPKLYIERDWNQGRQLDMSNLKQIRWFVANLCLRFRLLVNLGRHDEAFEHVSAAWRLASLIRQEPSVQSFEESYIWESIILTNLCKQLPDFANSGMNLNRVKSILLTRTKPDVTLALRGYIFSEVATARQMDARKLSYYLPASKNGTLASFIDRLFPNSTKKDAYYCRVLQVSTEMSKVFNRNDTTDLEKVSTLENLRLAYRAKKGLSHEIIHPFKYIDPELADLQVRAKQTCLLAMIEALRIKIRTGKLPDKISQIPGKWDDPYRNASLSCKMRDGQFVIYSIGRDLIDNGGKLDWTPQSQAFDIGVACLR